VFRSIFEQSGGLVTAAAIIITAMATALALFIACKTGNLN
jgi:hypothetical protein